MIRVKPPDQFLLGFVTEFIHVFYLYSRGTRRNVACRYCSPTYMWRVYNRAEVQSCISPGHFTAENNGFIKELDFSKNFVEKM